MIKSAARSAVTMAGALVLPLGMDGNTEASTTRSPVRPCTRSRGSTTEDVGSLPMRQEPHGWNTVHALAVTNAHIASSSSGPPPGSSSSSMMAARAGMAANSRNMRAPASICARSNSVLR